MKKLAEISDMFEVFHGGPCIYHTDPDLSCSKMFFIKKIPITIITTDNTYFQYFQIAMQKAQETHGPHHSCEQQFLH